MLISRFHVSVCHILFVFCISVIYPYVVVRPTVIVFHIDLVFFSHSHGCHVSDPFVANLIINLFCHFCPLFSYQGYIPSVGRGHPHGIDQGGAEELQIHVDD